MAATTAPGGEWDSPITSATLVTAVVGLAEPAFGPDGTLYHVEARPAEGGRSVLVRRAPGAAAAVDVTPPLPADGGAGPRFNVRSRVHEYGGGAYALLPHPATPGATLVLFSNFDDQRLYAQTVDGGAVTPPVALTREPAVPAGLRFADCVADPARPGRAYCVLEDHEGGGSEPVNCVAAVDLASGAVTRVAPVDADFVAFVTPSPDGARLAWVSWSHPSMPWDSTVLRVADVRADGEVGPARVVAGGDGVSVQAPCWLPDGGLAFVSDQGTGWWNVWRTAGGVDGGGGGGHVALCPKQGEFAGPAWVHGLRPLVLLPSGRLLVRYADPASPGVQLGTLAADAPSDLAPLAFPFAGAARVAVRAAGAGAAALATVATRPDAPAALVTATLAADGSVGDWAELARAFDLPVDAAYLSRPRVITFATDPVPGDAAAEPVAHAIYYPPTNPAFALPPGAAPPVLIKIHGGPTAAAGAGALSLGTQYWTSRGFAVCDVNYRGSTGYGRAYRDALRGNWGVADVADVAAAVRHLAAEGLADPARACIDGGSAGGFTTLAALAFTDAFAAGASLYGVADCALLARDTHKFESRYLDGLIGPYPAAKATYAARSPLAHVDNISAPLLLLQGDEDKIVPPNQAQLIYDALRERGVPTALIMYKGEQHGFRGAAAIRSAYDAELFFYGAVLGFQPRGIAADEVELPDVKNVVKAPRVSVE